MYFLGDDDDLNFSTILTAISTASAIICGQSLLRESHRDSHWIQFALLVALILLHNLIITSASISNGSNQKRSYDYEKLGFSSILELCYFQIFFAIFVSLLYHNTHNNKQNQRWTHFLSLMKIGMKSLVPSLSIIIYHRFFKKLSQHYQNTGESNTKINIIMGQKLEYFFLFLVWIFLTFWTWRRRRTILEGVQIVQSYSLPYQMSPNIEAESGHNHVDDWDQWSNDQLLQWLRYLYRQQKLNTFPKDQSHRSIQYNNNRQQAFRRHEGHLKSPIRVDSDDDAIIHTLEIIRIQRLNGSILPHIEVQDLLVMGIEYIHAVFLYSNFRTLIDPRPSYFDVSQREHEEVGKGIDLDEWLGKKIGSIPSANSAVNDFDIKEQQEIQDVVLPKYDNVNGVMAAKFGMELPQVMHPGINSKQIPVPIPSFQNQYRSTKAVGLSKSSILKANEDSSLISSPSCASVDSNTKKLDKNLLDMMPANIREIADRHPELVLAMQEKLSSQKSQQINQPTTSNRDKKVRFKDDYIGNKISTSLPTEVVNKTENEDEEHVEWNNSTVTLDMDEMVGLLRRRRVNT